LEYHSPTSEESCPHATVAVAPKSTRTSNIRFIYIPYGYIHLGYIKPKKGSLCIEDRIAPQFQAQDACLENKHQDMMPID
jgi:hypothetical protein